MLFEIDDLIDGFEAKSRGNCEFVESADDAIGRVTSNIRAIP